MFSQSLGQAVVPQITKSYSTGNKANYYETGIDEFGFLSHIGDKL